MRKRKKDDKPTCAGCKFLDYYNDGEPFCIKNISHACISSGFAMRETYISDEDYKQMMERDCGRCQKNHDGFCDYFNEPIEDAYLIDCPCKVEDDTEESNDKR